MTPTQTSTNPFALMMDPEAVFAAIERSGRLTRLNSRICRPLDRPMIARPDGEPIEAEGAAVDAMGEDREQAD